MRSGEVDEVLARIDRNELVQLALDMGDILSPAGYEKPMGEFVLKWLQENGFRTIKQEVTSERYNAVGILKGGGSGVSLIFNSHQDSRFGGPHDHWILDELRSYYTKAWVEGDGIVGNAVFNDRGPMAAFLIAAKAMKDSGVKLKGDLVLTAVVGEIGRAQIDEFQGPEYTGKGIGTRHLVSHGVAADYALVAECTNYSITWAEPGVAWYKITVKGRPMYNPLLPRPTSIEGSPNAIVKTAKVIEALEEWAYQYEQKNRYEFSGGTIVPKASIGAIRGGQPYTPTNSVGACNIYLDVRLPPGKSPVDVQREIEELMMKTGIETQIQMYLFRPGYEGKNVSRIVDAVKRAHTSMFGEEPSKVATPITSMWRDINVFNEVGIPSITYGPPFMGVGKQEGYLVSSFKIDDLVKCSKLYAMIALDLCSQEK